MSQTKQQTLLFRGIYEFEDPSGTLLAAKIPANGSVDLFSDTVIIVRPNQSAIMIYKGQITDKIPSGTFQVNTTNVPILSRLANWKFGFQNPLRCEMYFFAHHEFANRRWGTSSSVLVKFNDFPQPIPIRGFGNFNLRLVKTENFFTKLVGTKSYVTITEIEEFVQNQIVEILPVVLNKIGNLVKLNTRQSEIAGTLEIALNKNLIEYGLEVSQLRILSLLPSKEIIEALEAKSAIEIIGSQKEYLLYKAANSLESTGNSGHQNDPLQMMMGLMLGKGLMTADYHEKEKAHLPPSPQTSAGAGFCSQCGTKLATEARFCQSCGKKV